MYMHCFVADIFEVEIIESPASKKNKLVGAYNLRVNTLNMTLCDPSSGRSILIWPYRYIRRLVTFSIVSIYISIEVLFGTLISFGGVTHAQQF